MKRQSNLIPIKNFPKKLRDPKKALEYLRNDPAESWENRGRKMAINLFHEMARRVPAYKDFLRKQGVNPGKITTLKDFLNVPPVSKDNYLKKYDLKDLSWDGNLHQKKQTISTTSGSTGLPFYFPRNELQDWHYAFVAEIYLLTNFSIDKQKTLYVNAFPMGAWIGGVFTYEAVQLLATRSDYKLSIINPGLHKEEVVKAILKLGPYFDQVIIGGYGPFVKDILDYGVKRKVRWGTYNLKFIFSAESFSEPFRDHILKIAKSQNQILSTLNHYGTVDLGTMSYETPISIAIRKECQEKVQLKEDIFFPDRTQLPTFTQYIPELFFFEQVKDFLYCTANSGLPLVRYDLKDVGGVHRFPTLEKLLRKNSVSTRKIARQYGIQKTLWKLPFVYVYERTDFSVSFYAFQVYPDTIRRALLKSAAQKYVTGKFTMYVDYDKRMNQKLIIRTELKENQRTSKKVVELIQTIVHQALLDESSEYRETYMQKKAKVLPKILLHKNADPVYFKEGVKQKWTKK